MNKAPLILLACIITHIANTSDQLISFASETQSDNRELTPAQHHQLIEDLSCICNPPCTPQLSIDWLPCLHNRSEICALRPRDEFRTKFDRLFPQQRTAHSSTDPVKSFCVAYLRKVGTTTGCSIGSIPFAAFMSAFISTLCWTLFSDSTPPCAPALHLLLPFEGAAEKPCCCSTNGLDAVTLCCAPCCAMAAPYCGAGADILCLRCLSYPEYWSTPSKDDYDTL